MKAHFLSVMICLGLTAAVHAQSPASAVGTWRGVSKCLVHPSACHDEITVYRITPMKSADSVALDAVKIVNGHEDDMGVLSCRVQRDQRITCAIPHGVWSLQVRGDSLSGELRLTDNTRFREVRASRERR